MILIVDDDHSIRLAIGLMLSRANLEFIEAATERDTLDALRRYEPELMILDMNLTLTTTGRQGIELLRKAKILCPDMAVILITAWGTIDLAVEGMKYGADDFLTKPWLNSDFLARIRKAMTKAQNAERIRNHVTPLDELERDAIERVLRQCNGNYSHAAQLLGITRQSLYRRMEKYGLK